MASISIQSIRVLPVVLAKIIETGSGGDPKQFSAGEFDADISHRHHGI